MWRRVSAFWERSCQAKWSTLCVLTAAWQGRFCCQNTSSHKCSSNGGITQRFLKSYPAVMIFKKSEGSGKTLKLKVTLHRPLPARTSLKICICDTASPPAPYTHRYIKKSNKPVGCVSARLNIDICMRELSTLHSELKLAICHYAGDTVGYSSDWLQRDINPLSSSVGIDIVLIKSC